jgi:hypothetical protein
MLDRIIDDGRRRLKGGSKVELPSQFDREALRDDLFACLARYTWGESVHAFPGNRDRAKRIRNCASKLLALLEEEAADLGVISEKAEPLRGQLNALIGLIDEQKLQMKSADIVDRTRAQLGGITGSPLQALAGLWLPKVYEKHFQRRAGTSRPVDAEEGGIAPYGPYIRFAQRVFAEWKITVSGDTIDAALGQHGKRH